MDRSGAESSGGFDVLPKNSAGDMMLERARCRDEAANHQLPIAVASWTIRIVSAEECSSLTQNLVQIPCSTRSVILNATATHYTCSLNCDRHWLLQRSCHCSHMHIPVHCPWLPGCVDVTQTVVVILTTARRFLNRPGICVMCSVSKKLS